MSESGLARMGDFVVRQRLIDLIDIDRPLTVVRAPSGSGKTVAVLQWAHQVAATGVPVCWFDGQRSTVGEFMEALDAAAAQPDARTVIVLDHIEPWDDWPGAEIVRALRYSPRLTLVVCSRTHLPWFTAAELELEVGRIEVSDLRLTVDELTEIASGAGLDLTYAAATTIHTSIGGYAALARVGLVTSNASGTSTWWSDGRVRRFLAGHLKSEIVDPASRANLRRAAYIEHLSVDSLGAVSPDGSAETMLESLSVIGAVDQWVDGEEPIYYLPALARETLKRDLSEIDIGDVDALHDTVVARFLELALPHLALEQAVAGRRWRTVEAIIEDHGWVLLRAREATLRDALRELPDEIRSGSAMIRTLDDVLALRSPRDRDPQTGRWHTEPSGAVARLHLETIGVIGGRRSGLSRETLASSGPLVTMAEAAIGTSGAEHVAGAQLLLELGITAFAVTDVVTAEARLRQVVRSAGGAAAVPVRHKAASFLTLNHVVSGDVRSAERWRAEALTIRTEVARFDFTTAAIDLADTLMSLESYTRTSHQMNPYDLADAPEVLRLWGTYADTRHALGWGGRLQALHRLRASRLVGIVRLPGTLTLLDVFEAELLLSLGRGTEASRLLDTVPPDCRFGTVARARLAYLTGQHDRAIDVLASLTGVTHPYHRLRLEAQLLAALSYDTIGEAEVSRSLLRRVVDSADHLGLLTPFSTVPLELLHKHEHSVAGLPEVLSHLSALGIRHPYPDSIGLVRLTPREREVLVALTHGRTVDEIAGQLFVSRNTVKTQARGLYRKLGVSNRSEAVAAGHTLGLLHD